MGFHRIIKYVIRVVIILTAFIIVNNCNIGIKKNYENPQFLAHRGLAQTFDIEKVKWNTNTAEIIHKPEHPFIENTIPSMKAAFDNEADIVEFDIRMTKDKKLAVFHDYLLEYRTEGTGKISDFTFEELKKLDVGYGYTYDNGKTYPFRGKGIGLMPSIEEVFGTFPGKEFLVHIRDDGDEIGFILLKYLKEMNEENIKLISIYGNDEAIKIIKIKFPEMKALSMGIIKKACIDYELIGWTGYVPKSMRNIQIHMPVEYAKYLWGWPNKFLKRIEKVNTRFILTQKKGQWSGGFDGLEDIKKIPKGYFGYIWTERIDVVSKLDYES